MEIQEHAPRSVSVVVPTFREAENIPFLVERIEAVRKELNAELELLFVDDHSQDGSRELVEQLGKPWVRLIERNGPRSLSLAVIDGLSIATGDAVIVMDADLSHPPEVIPKMLHLLAVGYDFVLGSRYAEGGTTDDDWGFLRWLNSRVATLLAKPITTLRDPMSGFFAMWRKQISLESLNPAGYKIGLELLARCNVKRPVEVPIHFTDRIRGDSKLTLKQQLLYLQHLRRLYMHKFATGAELFHFSLVGASGVLVNVAAVTILETLGLSVTVAVAGGIALSMISNFLLNRSLTFSYARSGNIWKQFVGFVAACSVGALVNYATTLALVRWWEQLPLQLAVMAGVVAGMSFNFVSNRYWVFRRRHVRPTPKSDPDALAEQRRATPSLTSRRIVNETDEV